MQYPMQVDLPLTSCRPTTVFCVLCIILVIVISAHFQKVAQEPTGDETVYGCFTRPMHLVESADPKVVTNADAIQRIHF
jgi:hypothetical protein